MQKLNIKLKNCYGIKRLEKEFDFSRSSVNVIYARNGLMKTSLAKVFKKVQDGKENEIKDEIFGQTPIIREIQIDGSDINKEDIFVIQSFENSYESNSIGSLLIDDDTKEELDLILSERDNFLKELVKMSGLRVTKTVGGKRVFELEPTIIEDLEFVENSFLLNLNLINTNLIDYNFSNIKYSDVFSDTVLRKIKSEEFQTKIHEFLSRSDEIYNEFSFLEKGVFTLAKLKEIRKELNKNKFFINENKVLLAGSIGINTLGELDNKIGKIESRLQDTVEFKEIEKLLSDVAGRNLKDVIENNPEVIEELKLERLDEFKKKLWLSYIKSESIKFEKLKTNYLKLEEKINQIEVDDTQWQKALEIFENRFTVPFKMKIGNLKSSIIGESVPKILFSFCKDGNIENLDENNWVELDRDELEDKNTLSQGERRALYLLNIIFDVEKRKIEGKKTLFIIDDIADSFDYKNKYAIIEYLREMSEDSNFFMFIMSHNFDFYRTVSSRLNMGRNNKFRVLNDLDGLVIKREVYQNQPFKYWIDRPDKKYIIALIPFVRNLIEYGVDRQINDYPGIDDDYLFLTNLLHLKKETEEITVAHLKKVYLAYIGKENYPDDLNDSDKIYDIIIEVANNITYSDTNLENKIILALAIRLKAEKHMKNLINQSTEEFYWINNRVRKTGDNETFLNFVKDGTNQTRELYNGYSQIGDSYCIKILDAVNIMTPENIHLNSFMYEPILDMDIIELKDLFDQIDNLEEINTAVSVV